MQPIMQQSAMIANWLSVESDGNASTSEVVDGHRWILAGQLIDGHSLCCVAGKRTIAQQFPALMGVIRT
jgi:hypothetical protein